MGYDCFGGEKVVFKGRTITDREALSRQQAQQGYLPFIELQDYVKGTSLQAGWYEVTGGTFHLSGKTNNSQFRDALLAFVNQCTVIKQHAGETLGSSPFAPFLNSGTIMDNNQALKAYYQFEAYQEQWRTWIATHAQGCEDSWYNDFMDALLKASNGGLLVHSY